MESLQLKSDKLLNSYFLINMVDLFLNHVMMYQPQRKIQSGITHMPTAGVPTVLYEGISKQSRL